MGKAKKTKKSKSKGSSKADVVEFYNGNGTFILPNGDMYTGDYCAHRSGLIWREGQGTYLTQDGQVYKGEWKDDNLLEKTEISVLYPCGTEFYGPLMKGKYNGGGTYILQDGMKVIGNFVNNKPDGSVTLIDYIGRLWNGEANGNSVTLEPENIFYQNIEKNRGKSKNNLKLIEPEFPDIPLIQNIENLENKEPIMTDRDWEKIVFAKSLKTDTYIDFTDCPWYQNYLKYKTEREIILNKVHENVLLNKEEMTWYKRYISVKNEWKQNELDKQAKAANEVVDVSLLETFYSKEFKESSPAIHVIYPSYDWRETEVSAKEVKDEFLETIMEEEKLYEEVEEQEEEEENELDDNYQEVCVISEPSKRSINVDTTSITNFVEKYYGIEGLEGVLSKEKNSELANTCLVINTLL